MREDQRFGSEEIRDIPAPSAYLYGGPATLLLGSRNSVAWALPKGIRTKILVQTLLLRLLVTMLSLQSLSSILRIKEARCLVRALSLSSVYTTTSARRYKSHLEAAASPRRQDFYSLDDIASPSDGSRRPYPPTLDSLNDDEGFGAFDYDATLLTDATPDLPTQNEQGAGAGSDSDSGSVEKVVHMPMLDQKPEKQTQSSPFFPPREAFTAPRTTPTHFTPAEASPELKQSLSRAAHGNGAFSTLDFLEKDLDKLKAAIYHQNNGKEFNINAPKQVALVLFGPDGAKQSTRKDVLDAMASAGNRMADLILQYRNVKNQIERLKNQQENVEKGIAVRSASTVARPNIVATNNRNASEDHLLENTDVDVAVDVPLRNEMADPLILMDVSAFIFRAYYSMPAMHRGDGMPTGAVMGFCNTLNSMFLGRMLEGQQPRLVLCFDADGKTFRDELYSEYKAHRNSAPMDLVPQFELIRQAARAYGICQIEASNYEADDVIATLATMAVKEGLDTNILSGDKDLMQLITDLHSTPSVQLIDPIKKTRSAYPQVIERWGVPPERLGDVLALAGDSADNVPGVRGIGPKTAAKLVSEFGSLENLLCNLENVQQKSWREKLMEDKENALLSRQLVELNRSVPMDHMTGFPDGVTRVSDLRMDLIDADRILEFYEQMGFRALKRTLEGRLKGRKLKKPSANKRPKATVPKPEDYADVPF